MQWFSISIGLRAAQTPQKNIQSDLAIPDTNTTTGRTKPMKSQSLICIQPPPIATNKEKDTGTGIEGKYRVRVE